MTTFAPTTSSTPTRSPRCPTALADPAYRHAVMVTEAPAGVPATVLGTLADNGLETVVYVPSHERRRKAGVAADALEALGKDNDVRGRSRHGAEDAELLPLWLTAHRTRLLIPVACQRTSPEDLLTLVEMTQASPTALLFATDHGFAEQIARALAPAAPALVRWPSPPTHVPRTTRPDADAPSNWRHIEPVLPAVEYWTFYATAKRQLDPQTFEPVHRLYCDTLRRVRDWLDNIRDLGADVTVTMAHDCLKVLIEDQATFDNVTITVRAAQAAFHQAGWYLDVDERELRNGLIRFNPGTSDSALYRRLRAYREPTRAATVALYLAGARPIDIRAVTAQDLALWHQDSTRAVGGVAVPDAAAPYLRAALLARAIDATSPDNPAFPGDERRVNLDIRQAARDLDLNIGDANLNETSTVHARRVPTTIVKLERLS